MAIDLDFEDREPKSAFLGEVIELDRKQLFKIGEDFMVVHEVQSVRDSQPRRIVRKVSLHEAFKTFMSAQCQKTTVDDLGQLEKLFPGYRVLAGRNACSEAE